SGTCVAGIRPEHLREPGEDGEGAFRVRAESAEWLGADLYLHFEVPAGTGEPIAALQRELPPESIRDGRLRLTARLGGERQVTSGETLDLALDPAGLVLFDGDSGRRIDSGPDPR
ncbi:MAG: TOBE domain-containing protein, partial [Chromatiaceae bacterium]